MLANSKLLKPIYTEKIASNKVAITPSARHYSSIPSSEKTKTTHSSDIEKIVVKKGLVKISKTIKHCLWKK